MTLIKHLLIAPRLRQNGAISLLPVCYFRAHMRQIFPPSWPVQLYVWLAPDFLMHDCNKRPTDTPPEQICVHFIVRISSYYYSIALQPNLGLGFFKPPHPDVSIFCRRLSPVSAFQRVLSLHVHCIYLPLELLPSVSPFRAFFSVVSSFVFITWTPPRDQPISYSWLAPFPCISYIFHVFATAI